MIIERIKFYADLQNGTKNKYFCFKINSIMELEKALIYFSQRVSIRAAWYECIEGDKVQSNERIDLETFYNFHQSLFLNH